jgi:hypothetical protein
LYVNCIITVGALDNDEHAAERCEETKRFGRCFHGFLSGHESTAVTGCEI